MTDIQRRALHLASRKAGVFIRAARNIGSDEIRTQTANQLVGQGWAEQKGQRLYITRAGKHALTVPTIEPPIYLHARDGLTERRDKAAAGEPEVIDSDTLAGYWREKALRQLHESKTRAEAAARLRNRSRAA